jgi:hypothetical protein
VKPARQIGRWLIGCALTLIGCREESPDPVELRVLVAPKLVEVFASQHGDCRSTGSFRDDVGCQQLDWVTSPVDACLAYTCVREFRLERETAVLVRSSDSNTFAALELTTPLEAGTRLVLEGCDGTFGFELPPARADAVPQVSSAAGQIMVDDSGAAEIFASAASLPGLGQGYLVACHQSGTQATLPTSDKYGFYSVEAFGLAAPVTQQQSFMHAQLFPAAYGLTAVSTSVDLGPVWQAATQVATLSSLYAPCNSYCAAWNATCAQATDDTTDCATGCTITGEAIPQCRDQYQALIACYGQSPNCSPQRTQPAAGACSVANTAWQTCAGQ